MDNQPHYTTRADSSGFSYNYNAIKNVHKCSRNGKCSLNNNKSQDIDISYFYALFYQEMDMPAFKPSNSVGLFLANVKYSKAFNLLVCLFLIIV